MCLAEELLNFIKARVTLAVFFFPPFIFPLHNHFERKFEIELIFFLFGTPQKNWF